MKTMLNTGRGGQMLVKCWSNAHQTPVKRSSNSVKSRSSAGQAPINARLAKGLEAAEDEDDAEDADEAEEVEAREALERDGGERERHDDEVEDVPPGRIPRKRWSNAGQTLVKYPRVLGRTRRRSTCR
jgi:hypothetical protein